MFKTWTSTSFSTILCWNELLKTIKIAKTFLRLMFFLTPPLPDFPITPALKVALKCMLCSEKHSNCCCAYVQKRITNWVSAKISVESRKAYGRIETRARGGDNGALWTLSLFDASAHPQRRGKSRSCATTSVLVRRQQPSALRRFFGLWTATSFEITSWWKWKK